MGERDMESSLRIALLSPCYWPEVRRGTERFTRELADGLLAQGQRPTLITSHKGLPGRSIEDRLPILRLSRPPQRPLLALGLEPYLTHVPFTYAALRGGDYDLAHAVYPTDALAAIRWKRHTGRPAVLSYMGIPDPPGLAEFRARRRVVLRALAGCDAVVALSRHAALEFEQTLGYRARVIPPGVNLEAFGPGERAPVPTIVCSAAADVPRKNVGLLVRAFGRLRAQRPEARLILSRPRDLGLARAAGVPIEAPGVHWADLDDRGALARAYAEAWTVVLPSTHEAFGLVLVEALACGTPVVGYSSAAIPEIIDRPEIGRLFSRLDEDALAEALDDALELALAPGTAGSCRARASEFSTQRCAERYLALYRELS